MRTSGGFAGASILIYMSIKNLWDFFHKSEEEHHKDSGDDHHYDDSGNEKKVGPKAFGAQFSK